MNLRKTEKVGTNHKASFKNLINLETELVPQRRSRSKSRVNQQKASSFTKTNRSRGMTQNHSQKQITITGSRRITVGNQKRDRQKIFNKVYQNRQNSEQLQDKMHKQKQAQFMKEIIKMKNSLTSLQKNLQRYSFDENKNRGNQNILQTDLQQKVKLKTLELNNRIDQFNIDFKTKIQRLTDKYINQNSANASDENQDIQVPNQLKYPQIIVQRADEVIGLLNMRGLQERLKQAQILLNKKKF